MKLGFEEFEKLIMNKLLTGEDSNLETLRTQYAHAVVKSRELTGTGFFINFQISTDLSKVNGKEKFHFGDLKVDLKGVKFGVGFVLYIIDGYLSYLEGYTYDDQWPNELDILNISFDTGGERDLSKLRENWTC